LAVPFPGQVPAAVLAYPGGDASGQFFNIILPARAGEIARIVALHRSTRTSRAEIASTVVVERMFDVLALPHSSSSSRPGSHVTWLHAAAFLAIGVFSATVVAIVVLFAGVRSRS
jgi:hypothetical protein